METEPRKQVEIELQLITTLFLQQKCVYSMAVLVKEDRRTMLLLPFNNEIQKDLASAALKDLVIRADPDIVVYVAEAWSAHVKPEELKNPNYTRPSERPDRIEIIAVQIEFKTGEKYSCHADIVRNGDSVKLKEFEYIADQNSMGKFVDFYPPKSVQ